MPWLSVRLGSESRGRAWVKCPQMSVGGFRSGVGQCVVERVPDQVAVAANAAGEVDLVQDGEFTKAFAQRADLDRDAGRAVAGVRKPCRLVLCRLVGVVAASLLIGSPICPYWNHHWMCRVLSSC